jgi:ketosteroid isomerase-like protein
MHKSCYANAKEVVMTTQYASDEAAIRRRIDQWAEAVRALDLEGAMSIYAPDIVSFDVEPPLQHVGAEAKRKNWTGASAMYEGRRGYELRDLTITAGDGVAFARSLNRVSGTFKNGKEVAFWVRWTACFRKMDGTWFIVHDHVSAPIDRDSGRALLNLEPRE